MTRPAWVISQGDGPIITTAIHAGHELRDEVAPRIALSAETRLREEDPYTDQWLWVADTSIAVTRSRFEVDLNRPRAGAVYLEPGDAWGLKLWNEPPPADLLDRSLAVYDGFYADLARVCDQSADRHSRFVVLDLHSYNHRRGGPDAPVDDPASNPEINVGTGSIDRSRWSSVIDALSDGMANHPFDGGYLDVRENVRFRGGHMSRWINEHYAGRGCALAVEVKKFYMDEWTGRPDEGAVVAVGEALAAAVARITDALAE